MKIQKGTTKSIMLYGIRNGKLGNKIESDGEQRDIISRFSRSENKISAYVRFEDLILDRVSYVRHF